MYFITQGDFQKHSYKDQNVIGTQAGCIYHIYYAFHVRCYFMLMHCSMFVRCSKYHPHTGKITEQRSDIYELFKCTI